LEVRRQTTDISRQEHAINLERDGHVVCQLGVVITQGVAILEVYSCVVGEYLPIPADTSLQSVEYALLKLAIKEFNKVAKDLYTKPQ